MVVVKESDWPRIERLLDESLKCARASAVSDLLVFHESEAIQCACAESGRDAPAALIVFDWAVARLILQLEMIRDRMKLVKSF